MSTCVKTTIANLCQNYIVSLPSQLVKRICVLACAKKTSTHTSIMNLQQLSLYASLREVFSGNNHVLQDECVKIIGVKAVARYVQADVDPFLQQVGNSELEELMDAAHGVQFARGKFCRFVTCNTREEVAQHTLAYFTTGEFGGEYGYFEPIRWNDATKQFDRIEGFSEEQLDQLNEYIECCYYNGQPCGQYQREPDSGDEDCECVLGREYATLNLHELDEEEEKRYGVWQQEKTWTVNGYGGEYPVYYSLSNLKQDARELLPQHARDIDAYDGENSMTLKGVHIEVCQD